MSMGIALEEQETHINFLRQGNVAEIYTSDSLFIRKLDKLADNPDAPDWKLKEIHRDQDGNIVAKTYTVHKKLIAFRKAFRSISMTEEQKENLRELLRKGRLKKANINNSSEGE